MNKISKIEMYIDDETGVILSEKMNTVKEPKFRFKHKNNRFTKSWQCEDLDLSKATYYKYFHFIERRLEMSTNRIVIHRNSNEGNEPIDKKMLCEIVGTSKRTIDEFINECISKNYIALVEVNREFYGYIINPMYMMNGSSLNLMLYTIFCKDANFIKNIPEQDVKNINNYLSLRNKDIM